MSLFTNNVCVVTGALIDRCEWQIPVLQSSFSVAGGMLSSLFVTEGTQCLGVGEEGQSKHALALVDHALAIELVRYDAHVEP